MRKIEELQNKGQRMNGIKEGQRWNLQPEYPAKRKELEEGKLPVGSRQDTTLAVPALGTGTRRLVGQSRRLERSLGGKGGLQGNILLWEASRRLRRQGKEG